MAILNNLIVHGSSRFLNKAYFDTLEADTGKFNKLATKVLGNDGETITVHGLMDVQGELHTKSWSNSNIATIDGSFFICPTLKVTETGSTSNGLTITQSSNTWSVQITSSSAVVTNSVYTMNSSGTVTSTGTWTIGSKVAITGEILVNNEWLPLGTLRGIITARSSDLKSVTISNITDGYSSSNNILSTIGVQNNVKHRNIKISLYEWTLSDSGTPTSAVTNPIGIYMTALGDGTGQTMIDIYGGQEPSGTTYKGLAKPYVRIGNLSGLSNLTVGGQNPKGWGIYTSNGYFEGTIAARRGYIGNNTKYWTIGTSGTNSTIFSGPTTVSATGTAGTYLGTDGFLNTASASVYAQITNGILTAKGANITGTVNATSFSATEDTNGNKMALDGNGLIIKDVSDNILSKFGAISTIGRDSGNNYNINITGTAIDLRYNTNVLNRINSSGMVLYNGGGTADSNKIASFGTNSIILGKNNEAHSMLTSSRFTVYDQYQNILFDIDTSDQDSSYITERYTADGETTMFPSSDGLYSELISVTVDNIEKTEGVDFYHYHEQRKIVFLEPPQDGSQVSIKVLSLSWVGSATIGCRGNVQSIGDGSIVLGKENTASGDYSLAEGYRTIASRFGAHAEGHSSHATGYAAHSEGFTTYAEGEAAHAEGHTTYARDKAAHSEGYVTYAKAEAAHSEGYMTYAEGDYSHAQNYNTYATGQAQTVIGTYNKIDSKNSTATTHPSGILDYYTYAFIIGNGIGESSQRSNALTVDWNGNVDIASGAKYKINGTALSASDVGAVPTSRTVNGKALSANITLSASDVGAFSIPSMAGIIQMYAGTTPPTGWLVCDGTSYLRSDYPTLFEALGGTSSPWGLPDSTHFNVPDLRGRAPIGAGTGTGLTARTLGTQDIGSENIQEHGHDYTNPSVTGGSCSITSSGGHTHTITNKYTNSQLASGSNSPRFRTDGNTNTTNFSSIASNTGTHTHSVPNHTHTVSGGSVDDVNGVQTGNAGNMQPSVVVNFIICTGKTS